MLLTARNCCWASLSEAKSSYRDLVRIWHPDRFQSDEGLRIRCEEKVKRLNHAFQAVEAALSKAATGPTAADRCRQAMEWGPPGDSGTGGIAQAYDTADEFSEGLAAVSRKGAFGYVSAGGALAIDLRFSAARPFSCGMALVKFGRCGYINKRGGWLIRPRFDAGLEFCEGVAPVGVDAKWGLIDEAGQWLILPRFDDMQPFRAGRALAREGSRWFALLPGGDVRPI